MTEKALRISILGGTGWLGLALGQNLLRKGLAPTRLSVLNRRGPTADYDGWPGVHWAKDLAGLVARSDVIVLSVRSEDYRLPEPQGFAGSVLSFMAGVPLAELAQDWPHARIARAMPGGGATEGNAHVPWCAQPDLAPEAASLFASILAAIGEADRVADETALAVLTALSGSGAAYPALMARAMFDHALSRGIAADVAWRAVRSVVCDAPQSFRTGPDETIRLIESYMGYRGVTAAGIAAAQDGGFETAVASALDAATQKAITMRR